MVYSAHCQLVGEVHRVRPDVLSAATVPPRRGRTQLKLPPENPGRFIEPILALPQQSCVSSLPTSVLIELGNISNEATALGSVTFSMSQCGREFRLSLITDEEPRLNSLSINPPTPGSRTRQIQRCASVHQGKRACLSDPGLRKHGLRQVYPEYRHLPFGQRERVVVPRAAGHTSST